MNSLIKYNPSIFRFVLPVLLVILTLSANAQMVAVVNSLEDGDFAHPWDNPLTPDTDESMDGVCGDANQKCSLRAALEEAELLGLSVSITFSAQGTLFMDPNQGSFYVPDHSSILGSSFAVEVNGSNISTSLFTLGYNTTMTGLILKNGLNGIEINGKYNTIGGATPDDPMSIQKMTQNGILISGDSNTIIGNFIGISPINTAQGSPIGLRIVGAGNIIGGRQPGEGNIISGNVIGIGVYTTTVGSLNKIYGNKIGTNLTGNAAVSNNVGIDVTGPNVTIGGEEFGSGNVISGNTESGILMGLMANNITIANNVIGASQNMAIPIPNRDGITLGPGSEHAIVSFNFISNNTNSGILLSGISGGLESKDHLIGGNLILYNGSSGILFSGASIDNIIGSSLTVDWEPNTIVSNGSSGVLFVGGIVGDPEGNTIRRNVFMDNGIEGIAILSGQGGIQPPVIESYVDDGSGSAKVSGSHLVPGSLVDIYKGDKNVSGNYEGTELIASGFVNANGKFLTTISTPCFCDTIVATATDFLGNTSEFSNAFSTVITSTKENEIFDELLVFPNPSSEDVNIQLTVRNAVEVSLSIYDVNGREVSVLAKDILKAGENSFIWNTNDQQVGVYYYKLTTADNVGTFGKIVIIP